ncbi:uncharacterized protein N7484_000069 [Penicillium longicatenatum]|uniref:uncharacterized protein n=1 Tax=Penicillium longicatenatum TaxID=1561947 RepID=UPI0025494598|nr:uncharacterized protein N7484_000069 [Penicillium longicatenatum]KAJ5660697.1 hypothetical protein N7484_000069 [Penicillium longicatenatum]
MTACVPAWRVDTEIWTEVSNGQPMRNTRSRSLGNLEWTLQVYYENGAVNGRPLVLSFELMMRRRATGIDADIMFDSEMLNNVCSGLIMYAVVSRMTLSHFAGSSHER